MSTCWHLRSSAFCLGQVARHIRVRAKESRGQNIDEASRTTRPSGGGLRNEMEQSRLLLMIPAQAALVRAILNE